MKSRHLNHSLMSQSGSITAIDPEPEHARLQQAILALKPPILLIGLPGALNLSLLAQGIQADICDVSLARLGTLAQACRDMGLGANLYWQPLAALNLPASYANIVVAPCIIQGLAKLQEDSLLENNLLAHLKADGQLRLVLHNPKTMECLAV